MAEPLPALPCPECRLRGRGGAARIGNRRSDCDTCNRWAQAVMRQTRIRLKAQFAEEYNQIRLEVERDLYERVIENFVPESLAPVK